jgi:hypothetical protein
MKLNDVKVTSPFIEIQEKKNSFFVNGKFSNDKNNFDIGELRPIFANLTKNIDIKKVEFSSTNNFSFNVSKKLKFNDLKI